MWQPEPMKKLICSVLGYVAKNCRKLLPPPIDDEIKRASKDVAWEYVSLLAAALEMAKAPGPPIKHLVQEAFLLHARNLAEFSAEEYGSSRG